VTFIKNIYMRIHEQFSDLKGKRHLKKNTPYLCIHYQEANSSYLLLKFRTNDLISGNKTLSYMYVCVYVYMYGKLYTNTAT